MRKKAFPALMISLSLLLSACGKSGADTAQQIREHYSAMESARVTAQMEFAYQDQLRSYTLCCSGGKGKYKVEVLAPEHLAGICAAFDGEEQTLVFEDLALDAGTVSREKISPAAVLPQLMEALQTGYIFETAVQTKDGEECIYAGIDSTGETGKIVYSVLFSQEELAPLYAEVWVEDKNIFALEFTEFEFNAILN
ncbi:MAG: hypothetical protein IKU12_02025 [Oscillospiraceae bacterium]|nr:hypothetical protein [Oscillospiraceae bacterium]